MLALLSPSKTQDFQTDVDLPAGVETSFPRMLDCASQVMDTLRSLPREERHRRLRLPGRLIQEVDQAIEQWTGHAKAGRPAAFAYTGETYRGLSIRSFTAGALLAAGQQLRILSALYGVLRPLDRIERYRLDFGVSLPVDATRSLYEYWRQRISTQLARDVRESGSLAVVNLASGEFARAIDPQVVGVPVITPDFQQRDGGRVKRVTVFTKQARGSMARWIVDSGSRTPQELGAFDQEGYRLDAAAGSLTAPVFAR